MHTYLDAIPMHQSCSQSSPARIAAPEVCHLFGLACMDKVSFVLSRIVASGRGDDVTIN